MKHLIFLIFIAIPFIFEFHLSAQTFDFNCDTNITIKTNYNWENKTIDSLLNQIDFSKEDFEFRIFRNSVGLLGASGDVFIMKHSKKGNKWEAFFYHKTNPLQNEGLFYKNQPNGKIKFYESKKLKDIWELFVSKEVLLISNPSPESINKITKGEICQVSDCSIDIIFELVKQNCKHTCGYDPCHFYCFEKLNQIPEYIRFKNILDIEDKVVKHQY